MESTKLILTESVGLPASLERTKKAESSSDLQKKQFAKDFESIFIGKLLEEMNKTIGEWGLEKDSASEQVDGIFGMYLARGIAEGGGFGLWKEIYKTMSGTEQKNTITELPDKKI